MTMLTRRTCPILLSRILAMDGCGLIGIQTRDSFSFAPHTNVCKTACDYVQCYATRSLFSISGDRPLPAPIFPIFLAAMRIFILFFVELGSLGSLLALFAVLAQHCFCKLAMNYSAVQKFQTHNFYLFIYFLSIKFVIDFLFDVSPKRFPNISFLAGTMGATQEYNLNGTPDIQSFNQAVLFYVNKHLTVTYFKDINIILQRNNYVGVFFLIIFLHFFFFLHLMLFPYFRNS